MSTIQNQQPSYRDFEQYLFTHHPDFDEKPDLEISSNKHCESIKSALLLFNSHGLNDLNNANLMNRVDSKFVLPITFLPEILLQLKNYYSVLEINNNRISHYHNQYFDTPSLDLYHNHHNGRLNRYKVRHRHYVDTDTEFLEVKFKNNKKRTIKSRIKLTGEEAEHTHCATFIHEQMQTNTKGINLNTLDVIQQGGYQRIALANEAQAERLTLDFDLWYENRRGNNRIKLPGFFIAELKQQKISKRSPFYQLMSANNIFPTPFSKYCIGCALLYKASVKTNRFKPILSRIEQFNRLEQAPLLKSN